jgi:hypothetical protein
MSLRSPCLPPSGERPHRCLASGDVATTTFSGGERASRCGERLLSASAGGPSGQASDGRAFLPRLSLTGLVKRIISILVFCGADAAVNQGFLTYLRRLGSPSSIEEVQ